jgi:hypothetical protein
MHTSLSLALTMGIQEGAKGGRNSGGERMADRQILVQTPPKLGRTPVANEPIRKLLHDI